MESDDDHKPGGSNALKFTVGPFNPEIVEQEQADFEREFDEIKGLDVKEYFKFYPDYFRDELESLYREISSDQGLFFRLNLDVPSPLVWLLLNQPDAFLLACERCIVEFKQKQKEIATGQKQDLRPDEQREIIRIKEEIESYLIDLDLKSYQSCSSAGSPPCICRCPSSIPGKSRRISGANSWTPSKRNTSGCSTTIP
jgi:hypothetical protein